MSFQSFIVAVLFSVLILIAPRAFAKGYGGGSGTRGNGSDTTATNIPSPVDHSASIKARQDVTAANLEVNKANQALLGIATKLQKDFEQTVAWKSSQSDLSAAQTELVAARVKVLKELAGKPAYRTATSLLQKSEADRAALPAGAPSEDITRITNQFVEVKTQILDFELNAYRNDSATQIATDKFADLNDKSTRLRKDFHASLGQNSEWQAAVANQDEKKILLGNAQKTLTTAMAQEAQAKRQ